jgi:hypothetical protein
MLRSGASLRSRRRTHSIMVPKRIALQQRPLGVDGAMADVLQRSATLRSAAKPEFCSAWELLVDPPQAQPSSAGGRGASAPPSRGLGHRSSAANPPSVPGDEQIACRAAKTRADSFSATNKALHDANDYRADPAVRNFRQRRSNSRTHRKIVNSERGK